MPCRYESDWEVKDRLRDDNNRLTRVSCDMRTIIRRHGLEHELAPETRAWIAKHDEEDRLRIKREEEEGIRQQTLRAANAKLNSVERMVINAVKSGRDVDDAMMRSYRIVLDKLNMDERRVLGL